MRYVFCLVVLACPTLGWAEDADTQVEGKHGDRPYPFRRGEATQAHGLALALLGSCGAETEEAVATKERWKAILENECYLRVAFPKPRRIGTGVAEKEFLVSEILMSIHMGKEGARPKYILVRSGDSYRAFTKYDPDICAALQEVLRKSMP